MNKAITKDGSHGYIYADPIHVFEAFSDIAERIDSKLLDNITYDVEEGVLEYDQTLTNKHIRVTFDMTQGTPEIVTDLMQWLFSLLDSMANI